MNNITEFLKTQIPAEEKIKWEETMEFASSLVIKLKEKDFYAQYDQNSATNFTLAQYVLDALDIQYPKDYNETEMERCILHITDIIRSTLQLPPIQDNFLKYRLTNLYREHNIKPVSRETNLQHFSKSFFPFVLLVANINLQNPNSPQTINLTLSQRYLTAGSFDPQILPVLREIFS